MKGQEKINLLYVVIQTNLGGSERVVLDLARHIDHSRFKVHLAYFIPGTLGRAFDEACDETIHIKKGDGIDAGAVLQLSHVIRTRKIDVVNAHHYMCYFYSYLAGKILAKRGLVYTEHSVPEVESISGIHRTICKSFMRGTDAVVGVSQEISDVMRQKFPSHAKKIIAIPNGLDVSEFASDGDSARCRAGLGLRPEQFVIGIVANFRYVKNHTCLVRAFHDLNGRYPDTRLVMVGRGFPEDSENSEGEVRRLVHDLGLDGPVIMTGYREDTKDILKSLDLFCLPSFSEGLPVSILEAMAAKVAVVASDVRGNREAVASGKTGLLFPSNDDRALSQALQLMIDDRELRVRLRERAFTHVSEIHGLRRWISRYEDLFKSISLNGISMRQACFRNSSV
ncbi:MAG TPA: glycosyltransferase [Syntrophorhabdaceae bacterium]|jgi:glycosyltransferase involved in cell wall biosynthesis